MESLDREVKFRCNTVGIRDPLIVFELENYGREIFSNSLGKDWPLGPYRHAKQRP